MTFSIIEDARLRASPCVTTIDQAVLDSRICGNVFKEEQMS